ncbi:hypothetical protein HDE_03527 [Halotydeus destructor]|nr:hypothetical protein HDE_03527 [Halotydeus destructor]
MALSVVILAEPNEPYVPLSHARKHHMLQDLCAGNITTDDSKLLEQSLKFHSCIKEERGKFDAEEKTPVKTIDALKAKRCSNGHEVYPGDGCRKLFSDDERKAVQDICDSIQRFTDMPRLLVLIVISIFVAVILVNGHGPRERKRWITDYCSGNITESGLKMLQDHVTIHACMHKEMETEDSFKAWTECMAQANDGKSITLPNTMDDLKAKCAEFLAWMSKEDDETAKKRYDAMKACGHPIANDKKKELKEKCKTL